jgi:hypothetical protein
MLLKLQKKTLVPAQILGYSITLFIGITIILSTVQLFLDARPLLYKDSNIFKSKAAVVSKSISILKSLDKDRIYFSASEIETLKQQRFVKDISLFTPATFRIKARTPETGAMPVFYTDLFFESIAEKYLDVQPDDWVWDSSSDFLPIIIPEDYLNLYNFGFAESQGLPVLSKNTVSQVEFIIKVSGNGNAAEYRSKIVGFSSKINSILVPENFMTWANKEFGDQTPQKTSRILVEFNDPSDEAILQYFEENSYAINKENLEFSQLIFFFKSALMFVFVIAVVIIVLSISFILMSVNLILQKNKELILNLYNIGYNYQKIGKFYQVVISSITLCSIILAVVVSSLVRSVYVDGFENFFTINKGNNQILVFGFAIALVLLAIYNLLVVLNIKKIVLPKKGNQ